MFRCFQETAIITVEHHQLTAKACLTLLRLALAEVLGLEALRLPVLDVERVALRTAVRAHVIHELLVKLRNQCIKVLNYCTRLLELGERFLLFIFFIGRMAAGFLCDLLLATADILIRIIDRYLTRFQLCWQPEALGVLLENFTTSRFKILSLARIVRSENDTH